MQVGIPSRVGVDMSVVGLTTYSGSGVRLAIFRSWTADMQQNSVAEYCEIVWPGPAIPVGRSVQLGITNSGSGDRVHFEVYVKGERQIPDRHVTIRYNP